METGACFTPELQLLLGEEEEISSFCLVIWDYSLNNYYSKSYF